LSNRGVVSVLHGQGGNVHALGLDALGAAYGETVVVGDQEGKGRARGGHLAISPDEEAIIAPAPDGLLRVVYEALGDGDIGPFSIERAA
jgi:hypothetical protein